MMTVCISQIWGGELDTWCNNLLSNRQITYVSVKHR